MRLVLFAFAAGTLFAQQPILYNRGSVNAASLAPFGLPNAPIARGSIFAIGGERLATAEGTAGAYPLTTALLGVSISVTQKGVTTPVYPLFVSSSQVYAVMPSSVTAGLATLRLFRGLVKSNAITIQIANAAPGIFTISGGGFGPGVIQNNASDSYQPVNSLITPAAPGQVVTIWGTGLGPVGFPDNVVPSSGNVATPVTVTVGGQPAAVSYSGRSSCCSGLDQITATVPENAPLGCWVPVTVNAGGVVSNTATIAIAAAGADSCNDPGNPVSALVRTPGTQAFISSYRIDSVDNLNTAPAALRTVDKLYSRFYTRPDSPYNFDPYMSYPPFGTCLVHQAKGDTSDSWNLRGALPLGASFSPQPTQLYNNGTQPFTFTSAHSFFSSTMGGVAGSVTEGMSLLGANGSFTVDPGGPNQTVLTLSPEPPPGWSRPDGAIIVPRDTPFDLAFTPGDSGAPTSIVIYSYAASTNSTVEVQCLAAPGATTFTISADNLSNLPPTYGIRDGSYANLLVGTLGVNKAATFSSGLASNGILIHTNWVAQSVVLQ